MDFLVLLLLLAAAAAATAAAAAGPYDGPCPKGGCAGAIGRRCPRPFNQCPAIGVDGTSLGPTTGAPTCEPGSPGCKQGRQCQSRAVNPFMPLFHIMGNFTDGDGMQPGVINDISSIIQWKGVLHVFHQFGQCGWAHALSYDGAHFKNVRHPVVPDRNPKHGYDSCGCYDGSLTLAAGVNNGEPVILYSPSPSVPPAGALAPAVASGDRPIMALARPADPGDPELRRWTKDPQNPVAFSGQAGSDLGQLWKNGERWNGMSNGRMYASNDSSLHTWYVQKQANGFPRGGSGGQWFVPLPGTVAGTPAPAGAPTHLISTGNGGVYTSGWYHPQNETFVVARENLLLDVGQKNGRDSYTWATLQCSGSPRSRCLTIAWVSPAASSLPGAARSPTNTLVRHGAQRSKGATTCISLFLARQSRSRIAGLLHLHLSML